MQLGTEMFGAECTRTKAHCIIFHPVKPTIADFGLQAAIDKHNHGKYTLAFTVSSLAAVRQDTSFSTQAWSLRYGYQF